MSDHQQPVVIPRPSQWDVAFDTAMSDEDVHKLKSIPPFSAMDEEGFPAKTSLDAILKNETRLRSYGKGEIIVRQGDYGSSAFLILSGSVDTVFDVPQELLGRSVPQRKSWWQALRQWWRRPVLPEVRDIRLYHHHKSVQDDKTMDGAFVPDLPALLGGYKHITLKPGALFGEISALTRSQRTATVVASDDCEILEIKWQGLRDLMRYSKAFRSEIENLYRERSLESHLASLPMFSGLGDDQIRDIATHTRFETVGRFDWHVSFKSRQSVENARVADSEPVVVNEGDYADDLILIRSGFARVCRKHNGSLHTVTCLSRGDVFELETILYNCAHDALRPYRYSLRAMGYVDILKIPSAMVRQYLLPLYTAKQGEPPETTWADYEADPVSRDIEESGLMEFLADRRYVNGSQAMLINLERCVGCDDCVVACANAHDNNPRFIRHGEHFGQYMIANACMHCHDPVCMIGCPTGAIHRQASGEVVINDVTCIGCATCANSCPYNNIRMVNVRTQEGTLLLDETFNPIVKASKCDLCSGQPVSPSCEYACPHDALKRVDLRNLDQLVEWVR